jgi:hypothetical protein
MRIAGILATLATSSTLVASDWPDGPNKDFFQKLQRPDVWEPWDGDSNSYPGRSCCGPGEVVKTQFRVVPADATHPLDAWFAWLKNNWVQIFPRQDRPRICTGRQSLPVRDARRQGQRCVVNGDA